MIFNANTPLGTTMPVTVPADFAGAHFFGWPLLASATGWTNVPKPTNLNCKVSYLFDWQGIAGGSLTWNTVEPTQGNYVWTDLDVFIADQANRGLSITYYLHFMPAWASANPTQASSITGANAGSGGPLTSTGRTGLTNHITAVINRYKAKGTPIKYLSIWEEPSIPTTLGLGTWWGTAGDLVDLSYTVYAAAKAADSTITLLAPSSASNNYGPNTWITSTGTVNTGVHGYDTYDWYSVDMFGYAPTAFQWGDDMTQAKFINQTSIINGSQSISTLINSCNTQMGAHVKPIAMVSGGYTGAWSPYAANILALFRGKPALFRKQYIARSMLEAAALGMKQWVWYGVDADYTLGIATGLPIGTTPANTDEFSGDFLADTNGVIAGFNEAASAISGKTMTFCGYKGDGSMFAAFNDGSTYSI